MTCVVQRPASRRAFCRSADRASLGAIVSSSRRSRICGSIAAAEHDVGAAAGHVGRDRDRLGPARLGDDLGFARVLLGVQHLVRQLFLLAGIVDSSSEFSIDVVPTSTGWPRS